MLAPLKSSYQPSLFLSSPHRKVQERALFRELLRTIMAFLDDYLGALFITIVVSSMWVDQGLPLASVHSKPSDTYTPCDRGRLFGVVGSIYPDYIGIVSLNFDFSSPLKHTFISFDFQRIHSGLRQWCYCSGALLFRLLLHRSQVYCLRTVDAAHQMSACCTTYHYLVLISPFHSRSYIFKNRPNR